MTAPPAAAPAAPPPPTARVFIALWPDHRVRQAMQRHAEHWRWPPTARRVRASDLHVTLHFIGNVPRERLASTRTLLAQAGQTFELTLTQPQLWSGGIAVLRPDVLPPALEQLHQTLGARLRAIGLPTEARAFKPHLTLARRAAGAVPPRVTSPLRWAVGEVVLVESQPGAGHGYRVLARAPLAAHEAG